MKKFFSSNTMQKFTHSILGDTRTAAIFWSLMGLNGFINAVQFFSLPSVCIDITARMQKRREKKLNSWLPFQTSSFFSALDGYMCRDEPISIILMFSNIIISTIAIIIFYVTASIKYIRIDTKDRSYTSALVDIDNLTHARARSHANSMARRSKGHSHETSVVAHQHDFVPSHHSPGKHTAAFSNVAANPDL